MVAERGEDGIAKVKELTGCEASHIVLEAVGLIPAYEQAYGSSGPAGSFPGRLAPVGEAPVGFGSLFGKNAGLTGGPDPVHAYIEQAIPDVLEGRIVPGKARCSTPMSAWTTSLTRTRRWTAAVG